MNLEIVFDLIKAKECAKICTLISLVMDDEFPFTDENKVKHYNKLMAMLQKRVGRSARNYAVRCDVYNKYIYVWNNRNKSQKIKRPKFQF